MLSYTTSVRNLISQTLVEQQSKVEDVCKIIESEDYYNAYQSCSWVSLLCLNPSNVPTLSKHKVFGKIKEILRNTTCTYSAYQLLYCT